MDIQVLLTKYKKLIKWSLVIFALFVIAGVILNDYAKKHPVSRVYGESMTPGISPKDKKLGETQFSTPLRHDIFVIDQKQIQHKDVKHAEGPYLKRLVGLPGDKLTFQLTNGELIKINDEKVNFSFAPEHSAFELVSKRKESLSASFVSHAYNFSVRGVTYPIYQTPLSAFEKGGKIELFMRDVFNYPFLSSLPATADGQVTVTIPDGFYFALSDNRVVGTDSRHFGLVPFSSLEYRILK